MEKKTKKQNQKFSYFWENQLYLMAMAYDKIGGNYALPANSTKIYGEFISAMKTSNSYDFHEKCKRIEK